MLIVVLGLIERIREIVGKLLEVLVLLYLGDVCPSSVPSITGLYIHPRAQYLRSASARPGAGHA